MKTEIHVSGHVEKDGSVIVDESVPIEAGPVALIVCGAKNELPHIDREKSVAARRKMTKSLKALREKQIREQKPQRMNEIDELVYGYKVPFREK